MYIYNNKNSNFFHFQLFWTVKGVEFFSWIKKYIKTMKIIFEVIFSCFFLKILIWIRIRILNLDPQPWIENDVYGLLIHVFVIIRLYWNANKVFFSWEKKSKIWRKKNKFFRLFSHTFSQNKRAVLTPGSGSGWGVRIQQLKRIRILSRSATLDRTYLSDSCPAFFLPIATTSNKNF